MAALPVGLSILCNGAIRRPSSARRSRLLSVDRSVLDGYSSDRNAVIGNIVPLVVL